MHKDTWVALAQHQHPEGPAHVIMREANALHALNAPNDWQKPFPQVDVNFSELLELVRVGTQREKDLVTATNMFHQAWTTLHVTMSTLKEKVSEQDEQTVHDVYGALTRLGAAHLLLENLPKKWVTWLNLRTLPVAKIPGTSGEALKSLQVAVNSGSLTPCELPDRDIY